ncbi:uncharacterized protein LOC143240247 isoform X2 [Tachypleus tridentatus]|uniref:uncharacterized protein LOC143240247 isoform X2 n=1 Tax=Tachypleus tridentatus TaxID=6853 RepID=UPI003FD0FE23
MLFVSHRLSKFHCSRFFFLSASFVPEINCQFRDWFQTEFITLQLNLYTYIHRGTFDELRNFKKPANLLQASMTKCKNLRGQAWTNGYYTGMWIQL